jgi:hypothetical protein
MSRDRQLYELTTVKAREIEPGDLFTQFSPDMSCFTLVIGKRWVGEFVEIAEDDGDRDLYLPDKEFQILRPVTIHAVRCCRCGRIEAYTSQPGTTPMSVGFCPECQLPA